ncbi:hypothetical protein GAYE_SCF12G3320 [Galdieria yellowstonensis]|uniref:Uncharacterized protein n=1 Tax=Galdieria yellowstonensis TaxID=3028027 RepID=A0AAV9IDF8_9RHOD|nr:hypothetical protein GAYE_SCF12G3320 [Galdieria yellowstonensis]
MIALEKPSSLTGIPKKLCDTVDLIKAKLPLLPPLGLGTGVGIGCGIGLGWEFQHVRKYGVQAPRSFVGCGVGIGILGVGYGQGWGWYLFHPRQRNKETLADVENKLKQQLSQLANTFSILIAKWKERK